MFKYSADQLPVSIILSLSLLDFILYFIIDSPWLLVSFWLLMIIPKGKICAWNHHHQHTPTFKKKPLNRLLEFFYALHTGATTNVWLLHHVLGHHHNFLDQTKDESRWRRRSGETMNEIEYTLSTTATAYSRAYTVGKRYPKIKQDFLLYGVVSVLAVALLTWFRPLQGLFLFLLPMVTGVLLTVWATYKHHSGLDTDNQFERSRNNINRFYNITTGNLGYHTAHHMKQGLHWSLLPDLHEQIKDKIPDHLISNSAL